MRAHVCSLVAAMVAFATISHAEPAAPPITLTVTPGTAGGPWKITVANGGEMPMRLSADARLITLVLEPQTPSKTIKTQECTLPADARPATDEGRELVVPGKRSWSATFDPLFYCFSAKERALLVPGTTVKVRFGFHPGKKPLATGPFVLAPVGAAVGQLAPVRELEASPVTLSEAITAAAPAEKTEEGSKPPLALTASEAVDAARGVDIPLTITVANQSDRPVTTFFRTSTLAVRVMGPGGSVSCGSPRSTPEPFRELFSTIAPKQKSSTTLNVDALCPAGTFDDPGVYRIVPRLDTRGTSGKNVGLKTWDGEVSATAPAVVRVRTSRHIETPKKPQLD